MHIHWVYDDKLILYGDKAWFGRIFSSSKFESGMKLEPNVLFICLWCHSNNFSLHIILLQPSEMLFGVSDGLLNLKKKLLFMLILKSKNHYDLLSFKMMFFFFLSDSHMACQVSIIDEQDTSSLSCYAKTWYNLQSTTIYHKLCSLLSCLGNNINSRCHIHCRQNCFI